MKYTDFQEGVRRVILDALDQYAEGKRFGHGWKDEDLPTLFAGVDAHAKTLAERVNGPDGPWGVKIDMDN